MKRTFSINISGIIFYIEEDCYDSLKKYLNSIYQYFSTFEDSQEILEDVNGRIAEIFYEKLDKTKQAISAEDVAELIATMGNVEDFQESENDPAYQITFEEKSGLELPTEDDYLGGSKALKVKTVEKPIFIPIEEKKKVLEEELIFANADFDKYDTHYQTERESRTYKRLYRDTKRKVLGGVAAGLAHYLSVDAIWIRLGFIALLSGLWFIPAAPQVAILSYIILWMVVPKNDNLEENPRIKKLFRNPERGVLGGVCSGLAVYLGINEMAMRIMFILSMLAFGTGIFMYLILWLIIPPAKTLTEKMQMEGQTINLSNIVANIREEDEEPEMSTTHKAIVFPFQLTSMFFKQLAMLLRPMVGFTAEAIRIVGGLLLLTVSMALITALSILLVAFLGLPIGEELMHISDAEIPFQLIRNSLNVGTLLILSTSVSAFVPLLFLGLFGVMMLRRQIIWNSRFGWAIAGLWFISLITTGIGVASVVQQFRSVSEFQEFESFVVKNKVLLLDMNRPASGQYRLAHLQLVGYDGKEIKLEKNFVAAGNNEDQAIMNAQMIDYQIEQKDSTLKFDRGAKFKHNAIYRNQQLNMKLHIPYGLTFAMTPALERILNNTIYPNGYTTDDLQLANRWQFTQAGLTCLTCKNKPENEEDESQEEAVNYEELQDFRKIELRGQFKVVIRRGDQYKVRLQDSKDEKYLEFNQNDEVLEIANRRGMRMYRGHRATVEITMPTIEQLSLQGACETEVLDFEVDKLEMDLSGASKLTLRGKAKKLEVSISGATHFNAFNMPAEDIALEVSGASEVQVNASKSLDIEASGASSIRYRGNPEKVRKEVSGMSSIKKVD